ncbi:hypothetical protein B0H13DRAFT_2066785 [Mycena leptocephala]|nr:hypothetical protein B0H13DRAFT_2066785 [Mycena leptocephala]
MPFRLARWTVSRTIRKSTPHEAEEPEYYLTSLPNELLFAVLEAMDDKSLHLMAAVSKRFYHLATQSLLSRYSLSPKSGQVFVTTSDALRALRIAMTFYSGTLKALTYTVLSPDSITKDVRRIEALLRRFWASSARIKQISLFFGKDIIERPVGWTIGALTPRLMSTMCGHSQVALFVADGGLFTCKTKSLILWSPYTRDRYSKISMHDGSRQWVPSIRSIWSLDVTYPVCTAISPAHPWTMVVVNALNVRTLLLSIRLSAREWSAILSSIELLHLNEVGIWAETISSEMSTAFLNRHPIATLKYMSPSAEPLPHGAPPLALPKLRHLTALSHYIVHIFSGRDTGTVFPQLTDVELFPDAQFHAALHLLNLHIPLQSVTLWFLIDQDPATWPIFPHVDFVALNKCDIAAARLPALIARVFPGLRRLSLNHSFPKVGSSTPQALNHEIWTKKHELVRKIARANPGVERYYIDKEFFPPP